MHLLIQLPMVDNFPTILSLKTYFRKAHYIILNQVFSFHLYI